MPATVVLFCCGYLLYSVLIKVITARGNKVLCKKQDLANIETLKTYMITCGTKNAINYLNTLVNGNIIENIIIGTKISGSNLPYRTVF